MPRVSLQLLLALTLVLVASYYWQPRTGRQADPETSARRQQLPQTYLYTTRTWAYSEDGILANILEAERAEHFSRDDQTVMQAPRFYAHNKDDKTWSAAARQGRFRHETQKLYLDDDVYLSHDQTGARLETTEMVIDVQTKLAASPKPVTITQGANRTTATGMMANLEEEQILLAPNVESIYVTPPK
jgi:lipopolysaccharide export system protein LptC